MASSAAGMGDTDGQEMEEEGVKSVEGKNENGEDGSRGRKCHRRSLNKDDSGITLDNFLPSVKSNSKSPTVSVKDTASDAEMNEEWLNDSAVPSSSLSESGADTKSEDSPLFKEEIKDCSLDGKDKEEGRSLDSKSGLQHNTSNGRSQPGAESVSDKEDRMSIDKDELLMLDSEIELENSLTVNSGVVSVGTVLSKASKDNSDPPGAKRVTSLSDDSPKPKGSSGERCEIGSEREENSNESGDVEPPQAWDNLPDMSSDSDDEEEVDRTGRSSSHRNIHRPRHLKRRLFKAHRSSSDESNTSDEDDDDDDNNNDEGKNTDNESNETDDEVRKATLELLNKPPPKPNWFAVPELRRREYGYTYNRSSDSFREHIQGSVQMVKRLVMVESMKGHEGCVNALSFNRIGTLLASGSDDLNIVLWNWQRARPSLIYDSGHRSNVFQAKFMPFSGDCHVISCARDGQVRLAELSLTGVCKATRKLAQHKGAAHKLALELDSPNVFLSCGEDALTYLFDLRDDKPHKLVTTKENDKKVPLYSIHSNPCDSNQFCVGGRDHYIRVYDKRKINEDVDGGVLKKLCPDHLINSDMKANVTCACYNYNGSEILGSYNDEDIYLFDNTMSDGANFTHRYTGHRNNATVKGVNFYGPKSEFVVSGSDCGHVYFWSKETEAIINFQEGDEAGVINVLEPHPTLPVLATSGLDHDVKLWMPSENEPNMNTDKLKKTIEKNHIDRKVERVSAEPEMIGGQMLWFIMHHFRNSARRRMREEGQVLSSSEDDNESHSEDSDTNDMQCAQS